MTAITKIIPKKFEVPKIEGEDNTKNFFPSNLLILKSIFIIIKRKVFNN
jgi:hypothetical protein